MGAVPAIGGIVALCRTIAELFSRLARPGGIRAWSVDAMSVDFEGQAEVWREGIRRARKAHHCSACDGGIRRGELYSYTFTVYDGDTDTVKRCAACELIYRHLVAVHDARLKCAYARLAAAPALEKWRHGIAAEDLRDSGPDARLDCGHTYRDVHETDPPPEIEALAFATPAEAQALLLAPVQVPVEPRDMMAL